MLQPEIVSQLVEDCVGTCAVTTLQPGVAPFATADGCQARPTTGIHEGEDDDMALVHGDVDALLWRATA